MSVQTVRGGVMRIRRETVDSTGRQYNFPFTTNWVQVRNEGDTNAVRIFATQEDFDADANFIQVDADMMWEGPQETKGVLLKSPSGTDVVIVGFQRRA